MNLEELEAQKKELGAQIKAKKAEERKTNPKLKKPKYPKSGFIVKGG
ncbi:hypothetical protein [Methanosarcina acetivorans]|nr:hypothetical protein [Methanosarcina acetivorans]